MENYALQKLRQIRADYEPGSKEYKALTQLIQLERFRIKHGTAAYLKLIYGTDSINFEDSTNQVIPDSK